jgi:putative ABC transport system permease protein
MLRAKEVSLRKIVGAARWQLFTAIHCRNDAIVSFRGCIGFDAGLSLNPLFNQVSSKNITVDFL